MKISDRYLLTVVSNKAPKASRTNVKARTAIADSVRKAGGQFADDRDIGRGVIELYSKGSINQVMTNYHSFNTYHQSVTCEYIGGRGAPRLLSIHKQKEHSDRFYSAKLAFEQSMAQWIKEYSDEVEKARARLGDYFDEADYPAPEAIKHFWQFTCQYMPIADPSAFELGQFSKEQSDALEAQLNDAVNRAAKSATQEYRDRLTKALSHTAGQLRNGKRLHGSLLTNLQTLINADLNVIQDNDLDTILTSVEVTKAQVDVGVALDSKNQVDKNMAADRIDSVNKKLAGLF